ncbi:HD-GYP domain-containing protein [Caldifermentibacillus hisashii]|uniref:HD-GYP domain-containing protein n=1 Tax=Caldifermentibacillus hisashii TaxID=996558 RepID=UPI0031FE2268
MQKKTLKVSLLYEERRATIWFLYIFYVLYFSYDLVYYKLVLNYPWFNQEPFNVLNYILYIVLIILLPISIILIRNNKHGYIKYIYFFTYTIIGGIIDIIYYNWNNFPYTSGNIVEIVFIIFSPIFINKKYFYIVFTGTIAKLLITGIILRDSIVSVPSIIVFILGIISFIILHRFLSYVEAVKTGYNQQLDGIVKGIITTLELKDPYTRGHSERVAEYAQILAKESNQFNNDELKSFYYACLLHDIGKVNIPDTILTKPGKLTKEEFEIIKTHPIVGAKAVEDVEEIADFMDVILHHHERWDGKGYPIGLKGDTISFAARITAIADAFDAMTSSRSYRSALPLQEAYNRVLEGKGTQFDPQLVELFIKVYPSWIKVYDSYNYENNITGGVINENPQT